MTTTELDRPSVEEEQLKIDFGEHEKGTETKFDLSSSLESIEEAGVNSTDAVFFNGDISMVQDLICSGDKVDLAKAMEIKDGFTDKLNWAERTGRIDEDQKKVIEELMSMAEEDAQEAASERLKNFDLETAVDLLKEAGVNEVWAQLAAANINAVEKAIYDGNESKIALYFNSFKKMIDSGVKGGVLTEEEKLAAHHLLEAVLNTSGTNTLKMKLIEDTLSKNPDTKVSLDKKPKDSPNYKLPDLEIDGGWSVQGAIDKMKELGIAGEGDPANLFADRIEGLADAINTRDINAIELSLEEYFSAQSQKMNAEMNGQDKAIVDALLSKRLGPDGMINLYIHLAASDKESLKGANILIQDIEVYDAMIEAAKQAKEAGDSGTLNALGQALGGSFVLIAESQGWSDDEIAQKKAELEEIIGKDNVADQATAGTGQPIVSDGEGQTQTTDTDQGPSDPEGETTRREKISKWLKHRRNVVTNLSRSPLSKDSWKDLIGNERGEVTDSRKKKIFIGLGMVAAGAAMYKLGLFDNIDLNPFDGGDSDVVEAAESDQALDTSTGVSGGAFEAPVADPSDYGLDLGRDMPWSVAHELTPDKETESIQSAMEAYSRQIGTTVAFTGEGTNTMIQVGDHIANPNDVAEINRYLFEQATSNPVQ